MKSVLPLCEAVKASAISRGKESAGSYDIKMLNQLRGLLFFMVEKGFASFTWHNDTHKEIDPIGLQTWVKENFSENLRVEVMKDFFTVTVLK